MLTNAISILHISNYIRVQHHWAFALYSWSVTCCSPLLGMPSFFGRDANLAPTPGKHPTHRRLTLPGGALRRARTTRQRQTALECIWVLAAWWRAECVVVWSDCVHHPGASSVRVGGRPQRHLKVGRCVPRALHNAYIAWCSANVVYKRCNEYGRIYCMSLVRCVRVWVAKIWSRGTHYDWIIIGLNIFISKLIVKFSCIYQFNRPNEPRLYLPSQSPPTNHGKSGVSLRPYTRIYATLLTETWCN